MKLIAAKFSSKCAETGAQIKKGDKMYYDYSTRKCYSLISKKAKEQTEVNQDAAHVQAQEDAYFDNFCQHNNI